MRPAWLLIGLIACSSGDKNTAAETDVPTDIDSGVTDLDDTGDTNIEDVPEDPPEDPCVGDDPSLGYPAGTRDCTAQTCRVPEGDFYMGSLTGHADECPVRSLTLPEFHIDKTEVTWEAYDACVSAGACEAAPTYCRNWATDLAGGDPAELPVTCVTWAQAQTHCAFKGGRLPTEAEWEKAARGTEGAWWPWGGAVPTCDFSNFRFVSWYCEAGVVAVDSYNNESPYGPVDMTGNAWEWVADYYDAEWYQHAVDTTGPTEDCRAAVGSEPQACVNRVMRGGAFNVTEFNTRNAARTSADPTLVDNNIGFRCAFDS